MTANEMTHVMGTGAPRSDNCREAISARRPSGTGLAGANAVRAVA